MGLLLPREERRLAVRQAEQGAGLRIRLRRRLGSLLCGLAVCRGKEDEEASAEAVHMVGIYSRVSAIKCVCQYGALWPQASMLHGGERGDSQKRSLHFIQ